jgi:cytochrome c peroxidase
MKEIFGKEKQNVENINATPTWTGETQKVIYEKHVQLQKNFPTIEEALQVYINFLKKTLSDYQRFLETINRNTDERSFELNVNS